MLYTRDWDRLNKDNIRDYQSRRLKAFLSEQVLNFSPYYSKLAKEGNFPIDKIRSIDDLSILPFTSKSDIAPSKENPFRPREFILQPDPNTIKSKLSIARKFSLLKTQLIRSQPIKSQILDEYLPIFFTATTGRTALQVPFVYSLYDVLRLKEAGRRLYKVAGMSQGNDTVLNLFPYAPHLAFWAVYFGSEISGIAGFHSGGGKVMGTERILELCASLRPTALAGVPGYIYHILRIAAERGLNLSSVNLVALGAERTTSAHREKFREYLSACGASDVHVLSTYGFTEARMAFIECRGGEHKGYHLYPDMGIIEIIDPDTGKVVKDGEPGEVVYTTLDSRGTVVIRFRTGDFAKDGITWTHCPSCGRTVPRLSSNLTRLSGIKELNLTKVKGTLINLSEVDEVIHEFKEIIEWQIEIGKVNDDPLEMDKIVLNISLKPGTEIDHIQKRIELRFRDNFECVPNEINILSTKEVLDKLGMETELKEKRIVDKRGTL